MKVKAERETDCEAEMKVHKLLRSEHLDCLGNKWTSGCPPVMVVVKIAVIVKCFLSDTQSGVNTLFVCLQWFYVTTAFNIYRLFFKLYLFICTVRLNLT